ncbi:MAG TPA: alpha/beta fold hydrolase [Ramlibacter sp.]|jgi:pimeloyl-ACP methyl ester carboxylesterase|nr:alpha/beta fold hydrolase [Ramlibacter sp.]
MNTNPAEREDASPPAVATLPPPRWIDVEGVRTWYCEAGRGTPLVFIYGGNFGSGESASGAYTWNLNLGPLAKHFRVIAFDKLGQGFTGNPQRDEDYTMAAVVRHAAGFLRALDLPPVHLVGHSRGGYAATRLALENHELVRSLTVVNSGTLSPGIGTNEPVLTRPPFARGSRECVRWVYENYSFSPRAVTDEWVDAVLQILAQAKYQETVKKMEDGKLATKVFLPSLAHEKRETLQWLADGRLQRPTQVVWGFNDRTAVIDRGIELFQTIARHDRSTQFHVINESGHFPFREHPHRFNALLARFVALHQD